MGLEAGAVLRCAAAGSSMAAWATTAAVGHYSSSGRMTSMAPPCVTGGGCLTSLTRQCYDKAVFSDVSHEQACVQEQCD
jgi:hypothetical protein